MYFVKKRQTLYLNSHLFSRINTSNFRWIYNIKINLSIWLQQFCKFNFTVDIEIHAGAYIQSSKIERIFRKGV